MRTKAARRTNGKSIYSRAEKK